MITEAELSEIEKRCNAAQGGPWMVGWTENREFVVINHVEPGVRISVGLLPEEMRHRIKEWDVQDQYGYVRPCPEAGMDQQTESTLCFIAHSRTDVPKLIEEIRKLRQGCGRTATEQPERL